MSGRSILVDTSIVLDVLGGSIHVADIIQGCEVYMSVISRVELFASFKPEPDRLAATEAFIKDCKLVQFTPEIQDMTIGIRRRFRLKFPDAAIAATAHYLNVQLVTADKAFARLEGELSVLIVER